MISLSLLEHLLKYVIILLSILEIHFNLTGQKVNFHKPLVQFPDYINRQDLVTDPKTNKKYLRIGAFK